MTEQPLPPPEFRPTDDEIAFDYLKSKSFAVHWADGAIGGLTPAGHVQFALYSERQAIPRRTTYAIKCDGEIGEENLAKRMTRGAVVRELACDVLMSPEVAERLGRWLLDTAAKARKPSSPPSSTEPQT